MEGKFEEFAEQLQDEIFEQAKKLYGEKGFERWMKMKYMGIIENPDGHAKVTGRCGDTIEIFLKFDGERVKEASFITNGCASSAICGSFAVELSIGKSPDEIVEITGERILAEIGTFPEEERHCAFLASETLQEALNDYMIKQTKKIREKSK